MDIYKECGHCMGDGQFPNADTNFEGEVVEPESTDDCPICGGSGKQLLFSIPDLDDQIGNLMTKPDDGVFEAYKVLEATDITELGDLNDAQEAKYNTIISAGLVDLSEGSQARQAMLSFFDSESTTRANLITLIG